LPTIGEFQELMKKMYIHRDVKRGPDRTMLWFVSEVGEFVDAFVKNNRSSMEDEAADVLAWLCSICNLLEVDLEQTVTRKYQTCPLCKSLPCKCAREP